MSVLYAVYVSEPVIFQATSYPVAVCSAAIGVQVPNSPGTTFAPAYCSSGPDPLLLSRKKLFPTSTRLVEPYDSITVVAGTPITPSPFKSWWKLVSSDSNAKLVPHTTPIALFEMVLPLLSTVQIDY